jgi:hypothetical protein
LKRVCDFSQGNLVAPETCKLRDAVRATGFKAGGFSEADDSLTLLDSRSKVELIGE